MSSLSPRKTQIALSDYNYLQDIESRVLMAHLSVFEVKLLQEIIHHSLHISIEQLAKELEISVNDLISVLDKLSATKLFKRQGLKLIVDKEMRKYFEFQLEKFDDDFQPGLEFLQNVLNKVPIHLLPIWYAIPRSSDNIFASIVENFFLTPKLYQQYLNELQFDNPHLRAIIRDVYQSPDFKVSADELMTKYNLTRPCFEEYLLLLEYHFACCLSYQRMGDHWEEVVTPFSEWLEYLQFEAKAKPLPIQQSSIELGYHIKFNFIDDLTTFLQNCHSKKILPTEVKTLHALTSSERQYVMNKLIQVKLIEECANGQLKITEKGKKWISKSRPEQVAYLASDPLNTLVNVEEFAALWNSRNLNLIEKSLRRLKPNEWVEFSHFLKGFIKPLGDREPITLKNKGKKWKYLLPTYTTQEKLFIEAVIMERLAELGVVEIGRYKNNPCFCLTSFGSHFIH